MGRRNIPVNRPDKGTVQRIIEGNAQLLVSEAEQFGKAVERGGLSTSQVRNIFSAVKKMEQREFSPKVVEQLVLLKPKMAYAAARHDKAGLTALKEVLSDAIDVVATSTEKQKEHFKHFVNFFEAILAYHREAGGK